MQPARLLPLLAALWLGGCASFAADVMTPGPNVETDDYDGTTQIVQPPANASTSFGPFGVTLGMYWKESAPDTVYVQPSVAGIKNIFDVKFNANGERIENATPAQALSDYGEMSRRTFAISYSQFRTIATAQTVQMKVETGTEAQVTKFGQAHSSAMISHKLTDFLELVDKHR